MPRTGQRRQPFWRAVLGYEQVGEEDLLDPDGRGPAVWFQQMDAPRPQRNRIHIDISVPHDEAEARIAAAIAAGGRLVSDLDGARVDRDIACALMPLIALLMRADADER